MTRISKEEKLGIFDCVVRLKQKKEFSGIDRIETKFDKKFLKNAVNGFDKIWICATPEMHVTLFNDLVEIGVKREIINFV